MIRKWIVGLQFLCQLEELDSFFLTVLTDMATGQGEERLQIRLCLQCSLKVGLGCCSIASLPFSESLIEVQPTCHQVGL